jgi:hypothetical protein
MNRARFVFAVAALAFAVPAHAQDAGGRNWRNTARIAKWVLAGATIALGVYAFAQHDAAEREHARLRDRCDSAPELCTVTDGRYIDAESEALHQRAVRYDRRARTGIVAGQITLLGGVALFLYDLRNDGGPDNIPYPTRQGFTPTERSVYIGARVAF